jgi:AraC-like DNA-binding protein
MWLARTVESCDPDEFVSLIRPSGCELLVTERGAFKARRTIMDVGRLYVQRGCERLSRIVDISMPRSGIVFLTDPGPSLYWDGAEIAYQHVALFSAGNPYRSRLSGPACWGSLSLSSDEMEQFRSSYLGETAKPISECTVITPPPMALARLRSLHAAAADLAEALPEPKIFLGSESAIEQGLIQAMLECIGAEHVNAGTTAIQHHRLVARRFHELLAVDPLGPLHMLEISLAIGVSGRTLRLACQEQFGVSPTQYLLLRRMRLARRALRQADPELTRVTDVATDLGFWELGRFIVKYREIFGESPSTTLRAASSLYRGSAPPDYALA